MWWKIIQWLLRVCGLEGVGRPFLDQVGWIIEWWWVRIGLLLMAIVFGVCDLIWIVLLVWWCSFIAMGYFELDLLVKVDIPSCYRVGLWILIIRVFFQLIKVPPDRRSPATAILQVRCNALVLTGQALIQMVAILCIVLLILIMATFLHVAYVLIGTWTGTSTHVGLLDIVFSTAILLGNLRNLNLILLLQISHLNL